MAMQIVRNIDNVRREISEHQNIILANRIARAGVAAIFAGIGKFNEDGVVTVVTPEWRALMEHFATTQGELDRLCGKERDFNASDWGLVCLAYIAGDATCTSTTTDTTGTRRTMVVEPARRMLENLDAEVGDVANFRVEGAFFAASEISEAEHSVSEKLSDTGSHKLISNDGD